MELYYNPLYAHDEIYGFTKKLVSRKECDYILHDMKSSNDVDLKRMAWEYENEDNPYAKKPKFQ